MNIRVIDEIGVLRMKLGEKFTPEDHHFFINLQNSL